MKRIMMAGALGLVTFLLYLYARSGVICTGSSSDAFPDGADTLVQRKVFFPGNTQVLEQSETNAAMRSEEEMKRREADTVIPREAEREKDVCSEQFSMQKTLEGYKITLYDKEGERVHSEVFPEKSWVKEVSEGILEIGVSVGSPARYTFYFRKEDGAMSDTFFNAKLFGEQYIAYRPVSNYLWGDPLILTDIFEEGILYQEIYRDFSETADPMSVIHDIELEDETHIRLEYCEGEAYTVVDEVVEIQPVSADREADLKEPYALAYLAFLEEYAKYSDNVKQGLSRFTLAYIDDDEVPELLLIEAYCHAAGVKVFTFYQDTVVELGEFGSFGRMQYVERGGMIFDHFTGQGEQNTNFYRVEEGKAELICNMHLSPPLSHNGYTEEYEIDGISVDEETYQAQWQALYDEQGYILVTYGEGIPIKDKTLKRFLAGAVE